MARSSSYEDHSRSEYGTRRENSYSDVALDATHDGRTYNARTDIQTDDRTYNDRSAYDATTAQRASGGAPSTRYAGIELVLLTIAFASMIAVIVTPVTSMYYIFKISAHVTILIDTASDTFEVGVWGYCSTGVHNS